MSYVIGANCSSLHVCSDDFSQHDVEVCRLVSVKLEVGLGAKVHRSNSLPRWVIKRWVIGTDQQPLRARIILSSVVGGQLCTLTTHDDWRHHRKLTDWWSTSTTARSITALEFLPHDARLALYYAVIVCLTVRLSPVGVLERRLNLGSHKQRHTIVRHLSFWCQNFRQNCNEITTNGGAK